MKILLKGFFFRAVYMGFVFLVSLLIAKLAGATGFGAVSVMIVNGALIQILSGLGTDSAVLIQGISAKRGEEDTIFSLTFYSSLLQLLLFIVAAAICFYFSGHTILSGADSRKMFFTELLFFAGLVLTEKYTSLFYSRQKAAFCNKLLAITAVLLFCALAGMLFIGKEIIAFNPAAIMAITTFLPAVVLVIFYHAVFKPVLKRPPKTGMLIFAGLSFIAFVTNLVQFIAYRVDFWLIDFYYDREEVGIYAQAAKFAQVLWIIPGILAGLFIPALKRKDDPMSAAELISFGRVLFFLHIGIGILLIGASYILYRYFLPAEYMKGFAALLIMLPGYIFFVITVILSSWFAANKLLKTNLLVSLICCLLMLSADLVLIPRFSFTGAAYANLIAYTLTSFFLIGIMKRRMKLKIKDFFILQKGDWKTIL